MVNGYTLGEATPTLSCLPFFSMGGGGGGRIYSFCNFKSIVCNNVTFLPKNCEDFCTAKVPYILFSSKKNMSIPDCVRIRRVKEPLSNNFL